MKIFVKVKSATKAVKIEKVGENQFHISVKKPAHEGRANKAVLEVIAEYFGVPKSQVKIISGLTSKQKCIEIL